MRCSKLALAFALSVIGATVSSARTSEWPLARVFIELDGHKRLSVRRTSFQAKPNGETWRGEIEGTGEPVVLMRWKDQRVSGMFAYRGQTYAIDRLASTCGQVRAIAAANPQKDRSSAATTHSDVGNSNLASRALTAKLRARQPPQALEAIAPEQAVFAPLSLERREELAAKKVSIDVMVLYTRKAASKYPDIETDLIEHAIAEANLSFVNSGIGNIGLRLAHSQEIGYVESGEHFEHLYHMVDGVEAFTNVKALRNAKRADVVVLIVDDASSCGLATRVAADAEEAFAVVHHACAALTYSVPHEIGHIIGARHERALDEGASPFSYGHGFVNGGKWRDIMSYRSSCNGCPRLPLWSNPTIRVNGEPAGSVYADNARVLLEQAERVANFR